MKLSSIVLRPSYTKIYIHQYPPDVHVRAKKNSGAAHDILYMAFMFPPRAGPSSRFNLGTVRGLLAHGFSPTVVTGPEVVGTAREASRSVTLRARQWPQDEYLRSRLPKEITVLRCQWPLEYQRVLAVIANLLRLPLLPYFFKRGQNNMHDVARRALETGNYELIYSVNGVGVEHSAALELKRSTGLPWVAEFRDPWIHNRWEWRMIADHSWRWWCARQFQRLRRMLREIVETADQVVVESPLHAEYLIREFKLDAQKVGSFGMGFEPAYMSDIPKGLVTFPTRPVIGFVGQTYYGYQSAIKNLVDALKTLELKGRQFTLVSVGSDPTFQTFANEAKLRSFVPIGTVDHSLALALTEALDFGIVATCEECLPHINSKLWEYLELNLSILAIAPRGGSMDAIITAGDCGYVLPYDVESMLPVLETAFDDYENTRYKRASSDFVRGYSRQTMFAELAQKLEGLI